MESAREIKIAIIALREYGGVGSRTFQQLLTRFGTPEKIFSAPPGEIASLPGFSAEKEATIRVAIDNAKLIEDRLIDLCERQIEIITITEPAYPQMLLEMVAPPPVIYAKGNLDIIDDHSVAIVGSHEASAEAISEAVRLGRVIANSGTTVVSGLARGIDTAAHIGVLEADGTTIAVLGCGFDNIYPEENITPAEHILEKGLLLSEYPPDAQVSGGKLIARNRIIVGLVKSVIVVEITSSSGGTAIVINETHKQGKSLFTCFDPNTDGVGTNKMGAVFLQEKDDWKKVIQYMV